MTLGIDKAKKGNCKHRKYKQDKEMANKNTDRERKIKIEAR